MAVAMTISGDCRVQGELQANTIVLPASTITDNNISSSAAISAGKLQHEHRIIPVVNVATSVGTAAVTQTAYVVNATGGGSIRDFKVGAAVAPNNSGTVTVDLKKVTAGGSPVSILSSTVQLTTGDAAYVVKTGTIGTTTLSASDVLLVSISPSTHTGATNCTGLYWCLNTYESA